MPESAPLRPWNWMLAYRPQWLRFDLIAGLTTAAVVIPKSMAYGTIAGVPVEIGLYTACVPMLIYAFFGTSRVLSVSSTSTIAILVAAELASVASSGQAIDPLPAVAMLAALTGIFLLIAGALRMGFLANFISDPVLTGFKAGIGVVIVADQLPKLFGLSTHGTGTLQTIAATAGDLSAAHGATVVLACATLSLLLLLEHMAPRIPAPLVALMAGGFAFVSLGFREAGVGATGAVTAGLPSIGWPDLSLARILWPGALGIALMAYIESVAAGRAFLKSGEPPPVPDRELLALGLANIMAGVTGSLPSGGGTSQTAVNARSGAMTQIASMVTVLTTMATLLFFGPLIGLIPQVTLAAIVVITTIPLIAPREFLAIGRVRRTELVWAVVACAGVVLIGTLQGILVAVALSVVMLLHQANHPPVYVMGRKRGSDVFRPRSADHADDETVPGMALLRTEGRMTFASAPQMLHRLQAHIDAAAPRVVVLDCGAIPDIEYTALRMLGEFETSLRSDGIELWLAALNPAALHVIRKTPLGQRLAANRMYFTLAEAVEAYRSRSKPAPATAGSTTPA